jgi:hypothetical protein
MVRVLIDLQVSSQHGKHRKLNVFVCAAAPDPTYRGDGRAQKSKEGDQESLQVGPMLQQWQCGRVSSAGAPSQASSMCVFFRGGPLHVGSAN